VRAEALRGFGDKLSGMWFLENVNVFYIKFSKTIEILREVDRRCVSFGQR
jgi:hypothetical protein